MQKNCIESPVTCACECDKLLKYFKQNVVNNLILTCQDKTLNNENLKKCEIILLKRETIIQRNMMIMVMNSQKLKLILMIIHL